MKPSINQNGSSMCLAIEEALGKKGFETAAKAMLEKEKDRIATWKEGCKNPTFPMEQAAAMNVEFMELARKGNLIDPKNKQGGSILDIAFMSACTIDAMCSLLKKRK